ncbi:phosphate ABC transporter permease PstA [Leucobacter soli]|uniref:Phosphate transport system permease protein PstA n=1 Tax=Leucobacter soli TaxID=2812850 RepID=A0A916NEY4_9MICO|nr:phosphate ABC transporter permease PstA [Leucobacter soli]CAG7594724.1 hypothetical protein LEUCIP111803_00007 [Leucobacter soli]
MADATLTTTAVIDPPEELETDAAEAPAEAEADALGEQPTAAPEARPAPADEEPRRLLHPIRVGDLLTVTGAIAAALCATTLIFTTLAPFGGFYGFVAIAIISFLLFYAVLTWVDGDLETVLDRVLEAVVYILACGVVIVLIFVVTFTVIRGAEALPHLNLYLEDMSSTGPLDPLTMGGVQHAIVGTLIQIGIALAITVPLGLVTAVFLTEIPGPFARFVRTIVEAMTALPSIVAGLFVYATFILILGMDKSGMAASIAISIMMLPIMIRSSDVVLRLVPSTLKEASIGLGATQWQTVSRVVLPTARSGLTTSIILATARGIGETSPVLLTSGFTASLNLNPMNGPMVSLPLAIFEFVKSPEPAMIARGFGTAVVLLALVVLLFVIARIIGRQDVKSRARRQESRERFLRGASRGWSALTTRRERRAAQSPAAAPRTARARHAAPAARGDVDQDRRAQ